MCLASRRRWPLSQYSISVGEMNFVVVWDDDTQCSEERTECHNA